MCVASYQYNFSFTQCLSTKVKAFFKIVRSSCSLLSVRATGFKRLGTLSCFIILKPIFFHVCHYMSEVLASTFNVTYCIKKCSYKFSLLLFWLLWLQDEETSSYLIIRNLMHLFLDIEISATTDTLLSHKSVVILWCFSFFFDRSSPIIVS